MLIFAGSASAEGLTVADAIGIIEATAAADPANINIAAT
jgi:hypothetical protein